MTHPFSGAPFTSRPQASGPNVSLIRSLLAHSQMETTACHPHMARHTVHEATRRLSGRI